MENKIQIGYRRYSAHSLIEATYFISKGLRLVTILYLSPKSIIFGLEGESSYVYQLIKKWRKNRHLLKLALIESGLREKIDNDEFFRILRHQTKPRNNYGR